MGQLNLSQLASMPDVMKNTKWNVRFSKMPSMSVEEIPDMTSVEAPDGFTEFAGWSTHTIIDDLNDLWDFETDVASSDAISLDLFGIWLAEGEI